MEVYLKMPYGYQIAYHETEERYRYSLLKNGNFLFSGETERDCFDAMARCHHYSNLRQRKAEK